MKAIEAEDIEKRFGRVRALRGISLALERSSCTLITGSNGAGKSTLLRVMAGLSRPSRGHVRVLGVDPFSSDGAAARARMGYLGAEPGLYGDLTVEENLAFCARLYGAPKEYADAALSALALDRVRDRRVRTLSQGYRRRAGLARAALAEPDVLLLDEPWNGLDPEASLRLEQLLVRARERGAAVVVAAPATHGVSGLFDGVFRLEDGALIAARGETT